MPDRTYALKDSDFILIIPALESLRTQVLATYPTNEIEDTVRTKLLSKYDDLLARLNAYNPNTKGEAG